MITLLRVDLRLRQPGGVRAPETDTPGGGSHIPLARDAWDELYLPATSLAGSLRDCADSLGLDPAALFGAVEDVAVASPVRFLGTRIALPDGGTEVSARTAIDRHRAAPATGMLWSGESLPPGTTITCYLRLDDPSLLPALRGVLAGWRPHIGGGRSVGRGRADLTAVQMRQIDLATSSGLRTWLTGGGPALLDEDTVPLDLGDRPGTEPETLSWTFTIDGGLHIGTGRRDETADEFAPALVIRRDGTPYVPGSAWKGLLRARCEYILRSLGQDACHSTDQARRCSEPPVCEVCTAFGWTGRDERSVGQRARLWFSDSLIGNAQTQTRKHVGLDRVTGGARDGQLYATEIVASGAVTLTIEIQGQVSSMIRTLLELAVADLHDGYLGVGAATTRGLGHLRLAGTEAAGALTGAPRRLAEELA